ERRNQERNRPPAGWTDRAERRHVERPLARRAHGSEQNGEQRVGESPPGRVLPPEGGSHGIAVVLPAEGGRHGIAAVLPAEGGRYRIAHSRTCGFRLQAEEPSLTSIRSASPQRRSSE